MSSKKRDINNVRMEFVGNNSISVTGSCTHLEFFDKKIDKKVQILLECGSVQGAGTKLDDYNANIKLIESIDAKSIDFILVTHDNLDHIGNIPSLVAKSFRGRILMTKESASIAKTMWNDSAYIIQSDCEYLKKTRGEKGKSFKPYYKASDVEIATGLIDIVELNKMIELTPNINVKFIPNMHLIGSSSFSVYFKDSRSSIHKLYYSGDLGNINYPKYFVYDSQLPENNATVALIESTYGAREKSFVSKKLRDNELKLLEKTIEHTILEKHGSVLMPAFSLDRSQNLLLNLKRILDNNESLKNTKVVVDGRLTNEIIDIYERICEGKNQEYIQEILQWKNLIRIREYKERMKMIDNTESKIILSSSGFCFNGGVVSYLRKFLPQKKNTIIFSGYASPSSPAYKIRNKEESGQKTIKVDGSVVFMNAEVLSLNSFSSHIQHSALINFIKQMNINNTCFLIHGELSGREELKEDIEKIFEDECISTKVVIPKRNQIIYF